MRKMIAAATFGLVLGIAGASNPAEQAPETRAYFTLDFGGEKVTPRNFHYGLRIDHDSRFVDRPMPAMMQFDFTRAGLNAAHVNGMNVVRQSYKLRQAEEPTEEVPAEEAPAEAAPAEEAPAEEAPAEEAPADAAAEGGAEPQGFLSKAWAGIKGFFGGGDDAEEGATETAEGATEEAAPAEEGATADGPFASYGVVDWGLLALGAVGLGFAVGEVANAEETDAGSAPPPPTTAPPPVSPPVTAPPVTAPPITAPPVTAPPITVPVIAYTATPEMSEDLRERMEWLDGGTGHMGDLLPQEE